MTFFRSALSIGLFLLIACFCASGITAEAPADTAEMKVQELHAGGDKQKHYFVIQHSADAPAEGWRLLFVLPGGSGDAQFHPFVTRIAKHAVPNNYLVVQLAAPVWTPEQAQNLVWPLDRKLAREIKFSTPEFFQAVRKEVSAKYKVDSRYLFTLTWSSSGPVGYALSLDPKSGVTGTFVAMSVFQPRNLPSLTAAKGHRYFIYHSAQDFIPITQAETARDSLQQAGAKVQFQTYQGGHGWHGNIFGDIRSGIQWLEQEAGRASQR